MVTAKKTVRLKFLSFLTEPKQSLEIMLMVCYVLVKIFAEEVTRGNQQQVGTCNEEWQIHSWLQVCPQVSKRLQR